MTSQLILIALGFTLVMVSDLEKVIQNAHSNTISCWTRNEVRNNLCSHL